MKSLKSKNKMKTVTGPLKIVSI